MSAPMASGHVAVGGSMIKIHTRNDRKPLKLSTGWWLFCEYGHRVKKSTFLIYIDRKRITMHIAICLLSSLTFWHRCSDAEHDRATSLRPLLQLQYMCVDEETSSNN